MEELKRRMYLIHQQTERCWTNGECILPKKKKKNRKKESKEMDLEDKSGIVDFCMNLRRKEKNQSSV